MKFTRLRLTGFKSFVEPSDFLIEPGLTGIVGPNGCGKSNLVEALRWVMGESSYKNMRASGMDDVIFSGSGNRPARNTAEVTLFVDNSARKAPAAFNNADGLEVTRRIEREAGSVYKINGREVRARDVQLLFADASTGSRSPAMVGQGRIGELIAAKPQARRAVLEEAAGISGLYSRRNEAEQRLKAAEQNLERLEDVVTEIEGQLETLKRQARQANRYRNLSGDIRRAEAASLYLKLNAAAGQLREARGALEAAEQLVAERTETQGKAVRDQAVAGSALPALREAEAAAAATLQRLVIARDSLDADEKRLRERLAELERQMTQARADLEREARMARENAGLVEKLDAERATIEAGEAELAARLAAARTAREAAEAALSAREATLSEASAAHAALLARRSELERAKREAEGRLARARAQKAEVEREKAGLDAQIAALPGMAALQATAAESEAEVTSTEAAATAAERDSALARDAETALRGPLAEAERMLAAIETEAKTLAKILSAGAPSGRRPPLLDQIRVARGFEAALAAAFGDALDSSDDQAAAAHWRTVAPSAGDPPLPAGSTALAAHVEAPAVLARALAQIGVVQRIEGALLQPLLAPGQMLVSREGDLWRWDGFVATAEAPTAAAQRLANRNRLAELEAEAATARARVTERRGAIETAVTAAKKALDAERSAREAVRAARARLDGVRSRLAAAEREQGRLTARHAALVESLDRFAASVMEAEGQARAAEEAFASAGDTARAEQAMALARAGVAEARANLSEARSEADQLARESDNRRRRLGSIADERRGWLERAANAEAQLGVLQARLASIEAERAGHADSPEEIAGRRRALLAAITAAENEKREAAARRANAEAAAATADKAAQAALNQLSEAREQRGRTEERLKASEERRAEIEARIVDELGCAPHEVVKIAEIDTAAPLPDVAQVEARLERLKQEREKLGGVNLRAEEEATETSARREALIADRDDLIEAIRRLRLGIASLNREGRERLLAAFDVVNAQFQRLFTHLFGGGTAELQLTESDDPLEAGLEIMARPPGKKPQTMTLLSGGEQALTAMALIFAVFLTNPAPICVLDEVDAPLDDHNVERFCNLLDEMARSTDTRFVTITHNPITMARMNRLFGVTMAERGVSQLVSVDLEAAERFLEAG
ncbi:MAG: chromosome segregation protein SMC [Rhizobiales bacterium]|nr:chromosome segregation protein SMC [Hyphomicrobiales bacterium]